MNEHWILTAARCVHRTVPDFLGIGLNVENDLVRIYDHKTRLVQTVTFCPSFCARQNLNDIALVRLEHPLVFDENIQPACILNPKRNLTDLQEPILSAIGWGHASKRVFDVEQDISPGVVSMSRFLKNILVKDTTLETPECSANWSFGDRQCVQSLSGVPLCDGDAGGPIMLDENGRSSVSSIISYDKPRRSEGGRYRMENCYGDYVATRISKRFLNWIKMHVKTEICMI